MWVVCVTHRPLYRCGERLQIPEGGGGPEPVWTRCWRASSPPPPRIKLEYSGCLAWSLGTIQTATHSSVQVNRCDKSRCFCVLHFRHFIFSIVCFLPPYLMTYSVYRPLLPSLLFYFFICYFLTLVISPVSYSCSASYSFSLFPPVLSSFFPFSSLYYSSPDFLSSHVSTRLRTERFGGSNPCWDKRLLFFPQLLDRLWGPPSILFSWYRDCFPEADRPCVKLINHLHQLLSLRMSGAIPLLPPLCFRGGDRGNLCLCLLLLFLPISLFTVSSSFTAFWPFLCPVPQVCIEQLKVLQSIKSWFVQEI